MMALRAILFALLFACTAAAIAAADASYWQAYNACDMGAMGECSPTTSVSTMAEPASPPAGQRCSTLRMAPARLHAR